LRFIWSVAKKHHAHVQTLLALADDRHGIAIIPSLLKTARYDLRIVRVTHREDVGRVHL
jgi:hypothetical protein